MENRTPDAAVLLMLQEARRMGDLPSEGQRYRVGIGRERLDVPGVRLSEWEVEVIDNPGKGVILELRERVDPFTGLTRSEERRLHQQQRADAFIRETHGR